MEDTIDRATLRAALDRIIPPDDFPSAWDAGVGNYIERQLAGDLRDLAPAMAAGLRALDAEARLTEHVPFAALATVRQDAVLERIERGDVQATWSTPPSAFFARLVKLAAEGYYGDPGNGGNRDEAAWRMVGYRVIP